MRVRATAPRGVGLAFGQSSPRNVGMPSHIPGRQSPGVGTYTPSDPRDARGAAATFSRAQRGTAAQPGAARDRAQSDMMDCPPVSPTTPPVRGVTPFGMRTPSSLDRALRESARRPAAGEKQPEMGGTTLRRGGARFDDAARFKAAVGQGGCQGDSPAPGPGTYSSVFVHKGGEMSDGARLAFKGRFGTAARPNPSAGSDSGPAPGGAIAFEALSTLDAPRGRFRPVGAARLILTFSVSSHAPPVLPHTMCAA